MRTRRHRRGERGQVTPALLAAVLGSFAIAVGMFTLARGSEQSARSDTAADAAALAAAKAWHKEALEMLVAAAGTPAVGGVVTALNVYQPVGGWGIAQRYARANGAELRAAGYAWIPDASPTTWTVQVQVRQRDDLTDDPDRNSRSTSRVRVSATGGLCNAGGVLGLRLNDDSCATPAHLVEVCTPPTPATPNPLYVDCPQAPVIRARFDTERTFVD